MRYDSTSSETISPMVKSAVVPIESDIPTKPPPLYQSIHSRINEKIILGVLPKGSIIKEGPLASVFGVSRAPVRRALQILERENALTPANGQGFVVGSGMAERPVTLQDLRAIFFDPSEPEVSRAAAWESIYDSLLLDVANCLPFGTFRVSETVACDYFSIGRTALRDGLGKLQDHGYLEKSTRSHWVAGPLTARDVHEAFEVRRLLEPVAFVQSASNFDNAALRAMRKRVEFTLSNLDEAHPEDVENIENDLHHVLLDSNRNKRLLAAIDRNQFPFIVNRIFRRNFGLNPDRAALEDHFDILDQLLRNHTDIARTMLETHLEKAEQNTLAKLRVLSVLPKPTTAPYLINIH